MGTSLKKEFIKNKTSTRVNWSQVFHFCEFRISFLEIKILSHRFLHTGALFKLK